MADEIEKTEDAAEAAAGEAGKAKKSLREIAEAVEAEAAERKAAAEAQAAKAVEQVEEAVAEAVEPEAEVAEAEVVEPAAEEVVAEEAVEQAAEEAAAEVAEPEAVEPVEQAEETVVEEASEPAPKPEPEPAPVPAAEVVKEDVAPEEDKPKTKRAPRKKAVKKSTAKKSVGAKADTATRGKVSSDVKDDIADIADNAEAAAEAEAEKPKAKSKSVKAREAKAEAKAAKEAAIAENKGDGYVAEAPRKGLSWAVALGFALLGCALGLLIGHFLLPSSSIPGIAADNSSLSASDLDSTVGMLNYKGEEISISAREVLESTVGVDAALNDDGSYDMPSADDVLSFARNAILNKEVEAAGIQVSDEDISAYMTEFMGNDDISAMATQYGLDEESARKIISESAGVRKLYQQVTAEAGTAAAMPEAPAALPEDADPAAPTPEYAAYIIGLLGDEWDAANNTWAREDGPYYAQMSTMDFNAEGATYDQAQTAYYVAYTNYATQATTAQQLWTDYVNGLLSGASISIASLAS